MHWGLIRHFPWIDTRARFVASLPPKGWLLDIGSSDGETLAHFRELRPDLQLYATDLAGSPDRYPDDCQFFQGDIQEIKLPWPPGRFSGVTCLQLMEHLQTYENVFSEVSRLLKPGGRAFFETPHPRSTTYSSAGGRHAGTHTVNFYDDLTHIRPVTTGAMAQFARRYDLRIETSGISRNWLYAAAYLVLMFGPGGRKKFTSANHFRGWSSYLVASKP